MCWKISIQNKILYSFIEVNIYFNWYNDVIINLCKGSVLELNLLLLVMENQLLFIVYYN